LWPSLFLATRLIKRLAARRGVPPKFVIHIGAIDINPKHLAIWIATDKDWERDQLLRDSAFVTDCHAVLLRTGYPSEALPFVGVAIESQQTVDRVFRTMALGHAVVLSESNLP
jgi:hypothetical protein